MAELRDRGQWSFSALLPRCFLILRARRVEPRGVLLGCKALPRPFASRLLRLRASALRTPPVLFALRDVGFLGFVVARQSTPLDMRSSNDD